MGNNAVIYYVDSVFDTHYKLASKHKQTLTIFSSMPLRPQALFPKWIVRQELEQNKILYFVADPILFLTSSLRSCAVWPYFLAIKELGLER